MSLVYRQWIYTRSYIFDKRFNFNKIIMIEKFQQGGQLDQIFNAINSQPEQALQ